MMAGKKVKLSKEVLEKCPYLHNTNKEQTGLSQAVVFATLFGFAADHLSRGDSITFFVPDNAESDNEEISKE